ncbi:saccharopine dehydrogenase [Thermoanaerobacteraceae bacterium SP2]|nr:saccharopine dehydrogenase [Thermoanaerobacteraceae bacterium SP2]
MGGKVLLLGMGMQGSAALYDLVKSEAVDYITVVDNKTDLDEKLRNYDNVKGISLDIENDQKDLINLMENADVVVELLPAKFTFPVAKMAVQVGKNLVSAMYFNDPGEEDPVKVQERRQDINALDNLAKEKGIIMLSEFGMDPGLDLIIGKKAIEEFDEVVDFYSYGAGFPEFSCANNPLKYKFTWSITGVLMSYLRPAVIIKNGNIMEIAAREIFAEKNRHYLQIDELGDALESYPNGNSVHYAELLGIKNSVQNMARFTCRWPGHGDFWERMARCGFLDRKPISVGKLQISPLEFCAALLGGQKQFYYGPQERDVALIRVDVRGIKDGKEQRVIYQVIDYRDLDTGLTAMSRTTGFTASIGAQLILKGKITKKGLLTPLDIPYGMVEDEISMRGIKVEKNISN